MFVTVFIKGEKAKKQHENPINTVNSALTKEPKQYNGARIVSSRNGAEQLDIGMHKHESRHRPYTFTKINSKIIIDLNLRCTPIKLLENITGENSDDLK